MYKKSFFRGLGTGLVVGALTMTVAFNFDNAGKSDSNQGKTAVVSQQDKDTESQTSDSDKDTKGTTADSKTTEKAKNDKATTEKAKDDSKTTDKTASADTSDVNGKGDVYSDGSNASNGETADGNGATGNAGTSDGSTANGTSDGSSKSDGSGTSDGSGLSDSSSMSSGKADGSSTSDGSMSDNTQKVPSSKDNGYTEDKNSQQSSGDTTNGGSGATTEAQKPSAIKYDNGGGQITIVDGMSAYEICQLLEQIGLRDADEYYDWLLRSGYSQSLVSGTYTFTGNETNGGIVWILLGHQ